VRCELKTRCAPCRGVWRLIYVKNLNAFLRLPRLVVLVYTPYLQRK
jgi:hypothetical protein